eukprot:2984446-Rhodomonas_salina.1
MQIHSRFEHLDFPRFAVAARQETDLRSWNLLRKAFSGEKEGHISAVPCIQPLHLTRKKESNWQCTNIN